MNYYKQHITKKNHKYLLHRQQVSCLQYSSRFCYLEIKC